MRTRVLNRVVLAVVISSGSLVASPPALCLAAEHPELAIWPNGLPADAKPVAPERVEELKAKLTDGCLPRP